VAEASPPSDESAVPGAPPDATALPASPALCLLLAQRIHDDVLQSLALCSLQGELARRLWAAGQPEQALAELGGMGEALEAAVAALRDVTATLIAAASLPSSTEE
jgi:Histidine kinase